MANSQKYTASKKGGTMALICIIYGLWGVIYSLPVPFFPREAVKCGLSVLEIGVIFAMSPAAVFVCSPLCAILLPSIGSKYMFWAGMTIEGGCTILFGTLTLMDDRISFLVFALLIRFTQGIGGAIQGVAIESTVIVLYRDRIASAKGFIETCLGIGYATGPLIGAGLYKAGGYAMPFLVIGSIVILTAPIATYTLPQVADANVAPWKSMIKLSKSFYIILLCFGIFIQVASQTFIETNYSIRLTIFHMDVVKSAAIILISATSYAVIGITVGFASDYFGYKKFILSGFFLIAIALQMMGSFPYFKIKPTLWHFMVGSALYGVGAGAVMMPMSAEMVRYASENDIGDNLGVYSSVAGLFKVFQSLGTICGPSVGSSLTSVTSIGFSWTSSIFGFLALLQFLIFACYNIYEINYKPKKPTKVIDNCRTYEKLSSIEEVQEEHVSKDGENHTIKSKDIVYDNTETGAQVLECDDRQKKISDSTKL
ncbi:MFS-type transporter SLC18B1 [Trichoplax sp. H2]|nr:MFS-type transporter SLC18B1 [Trichoplax sp. H2]|eukprot:RDD42096.1 MFS-type transporter SLC18B1 [Trichoplax sp. H2]